MSFRYPTPLSAEVIDLEDIAAPTILVDRLSMDDTHDVPSATKDSDSRSKCPIHSLPDDILLELFLILADDHPDGSNVAYLKTMAVCRRWRHLVIHSPLCWANVEIGCGLYEVTSCFARSGRTQPIDVTLNFQGIMESRVSFEDVCATTMPHRAQIRSLHVINIVHWLQFPYFLEMWKRYQVDTPNLKSISVTASRRNFKPQTLAVIPLANPEFDNDWPGASSVESLTLNFFNPFSVPRFDKLTFLEMSVAGVPVQVLPAIFSRSPLLETLILHIYETDCPIQPVTTSSRQSVAHSLRYLGIGVSNGIETYEYLGSEMDDLRYISAPNLEGLDIMYCKWGTIMSEVIGTFSNLQRLRIREEISREDIDFLSSLQAKTITLEIVHMPVHESTIQLLLSLSNFKRIIWTFESPRYGFKVQSNFQRMSNMMRRLRPLVNCPNIMEIPPGEEIPSDGMILGNNFTVRTAKKWDPWLLRLGSLEYELTRNSESFSSDSS